MKVSFSAPSIPKTGALVVAVLAERKLSPAAADLDQRTGGLISRSLAANQRFKGAREEILSLAAPAIPDLSRIVLLGLGDAEKIDGKAMQRVGGVLLAHLNQVGEEKAAVIVDAVEGSLAEAAADLAFGGLLRAYRFAKYRTNEKPERMPSMAKLTVMCEGAGAARKAFTSRERLAQGVYLARDLVSEPANVLTPPAFAARCLELRDDGLDVEVLDEKAMRKLGMRALLAVGQGSSAESHLVVMRWGGGKNKSDPPATFVGKGVTFDTGGLSLKPPAGMEEMKWDMAGAGAVVGAMRALARRKAKANVVGIVGLVENMPSGSAQRPGDVVASASGRTIEVLNTDAEGRLVLADALWYAQNRFKPTVMIDLATLTGAIMVSLGLHKAGLFASDDRLAHELIAAGDAVGEPLWRMPMGKEYDAEIDSDIADVKNIASHRWGGSIIGAQFLKRFVNDVPWAHLDIAGVAWSKKDAPTVPKGGTGFGVRLLDRFVAARCER